MSRHWPLAAILVVYLLVAGLYALLTPPWQTPDEPAHYNYIRQLAEGEWPVIRPGDYDQAYQQQVLDSEFDPRFSVASFEYEDYQPPLYYLLLTPLFRAAGGDLTALRLGSVVLGAGVVVFAYAIGRRLFAGRPWPAAGAAAFVAFLPQHVAMLAAVNNDSLAELLIAAILFLLARLLTDPRPDRPPARLHLLLGALLGLGFLTKATVYPLAAVVALALYYLGRPRAQARAGLVVFGLAAALGALWWLRNVAVYQAPDLLGIGAHNAVVTGQPRTAEWLARLGPAGYLAAFGRTTFQSFWGQFGWMGVPMPAWVYAALLLFSVLTLAGLALRIGRPRTYRRPELDANPGRLPGRPALIIVLLATFLLSLLLYLGYNLTFVQHQGRYLFPALIPVALAVAAGWDRLLAPLALGRPGWYAFWAGGLALGLAGLDLLALYRFILPALS
ncbi:MAG: DUF2142 domain-containing protein [Candidatus Promineifilaceae bacterium]